MQTTKAVQSRIIIVGAGFGGLYATKRLAGTAAEITLIDRSNHHLFQPLLYQVATAALSAADIATPIRAVFARYSNVRVIMGEVPALIRQPARSPSATSAIFHTTSSCWRLAPPPRGSATPSGQLPAPA